MSSETNSEKQILATVAYYDLFNYPLTAFEVFLYLVNENMVETRHCLVSTAEIIDLLDSSEYLKKHINQKHGFYFLKRTPPSSPLSGGGIKCESASRFHSPNGTMELSDEKTTEPANVETRQCLVSTGIETNIVQQRLNRKKLADQKWKKAKKIFWIMQITPFLKMVLISGSLAMGNSKDESDIDIMITAKKGRIWIVRTFVTLLTSVLGTRRHSNITKNKICLNHYITDESLKIPFESLYNAQSYVHLTNVYNSEEDRRIFRKFQEENKWIEKYACNYKLSELGGFRSIGRNKILGLVSGFFELILSGMVGNYLEKKLSEIQSRRIRKDKLYKKKGGRITIDDDQLEFHPNSHEANIIPEFNRRMKELELFEFGGQKDSGLT